MGAGLIPMASADGVTVSIGSGSAAKGGTAVVPLMIYNVSNLGSAVVNLTFNESVVNVTAVSNSDFYQPPNLYTRGPGWVLLQAGQFTTGLTGDVKMCDVTLEAVGNEGTTSSLDLTDVKLEDMTMTSITVDSIVDGTFSVSGPPVTSVTTIPEKPPTGWFTGDVTLWFRVTDYSGTGINYTVFNITNEAKGIINESQVKPVLNATSGKYEFTWTMDASTYEGVNNITFYSVDNASMVETETQKETIQIDVTPPAGILGLSCVDKGTTWINWTWTNPTDALSGFNYTEIQIRKKDVTDTTSNEFYNATGLSPNTTYEISTRTVDIAGNKNTTWVNDTAKTLSTPYGVELTVHVREQLVAPGKNATYILTVKNIGTNMDNYTLKVDNLNNADIAVLEKNVTKNTHYKTVNVSPGDSIIVLLSVSNPTPGTFRVNVTANSTGDPTQIAYVNTTTIVSPINITAFDVDSIAKRGHTLNASITIRNEGSSAIDVTVVVSGLQNETGYSVVGTGVLANIGAGQEMTLPVLVYVPATTDTGKYRLFADIWLYEDYPDVTKAITRGPEVTSVTS